MVGGGGTFLDSQGRVSRKTHRAEPLVLAGWVPEA
jgi:hypothetical protein